MRIQVALLALLLSGAALAQNSVTLTELATYNLLRGSSTIATIEGADIDAAEAACRAEAIRRAEADPRTSGTVKYRCQTPRLDITATYSPVVTPPTPVDCVVSDWTLGTPQPTTCPVSGQQTRVDTRTVLTQPANGGAACPPLTQTVVVPCVFVPPNPGGDTITNGQAVTVTGSGFGTKPQAAPLTFDDFASGTAGAAVGGKAAVVGRWPSGDFCTAVTYGTHDGHTVAKHTFAGGTYNASLCVDPAPTTTVYLDFWAKGVARGNPSRNWKVWRFYSANDSDVGNIVYYCRGGGVELGSWTWLAETPPPTGWIHYEVIQRPGGSRHYRNSKLDSSSTGAPSVAQIRIGHYWGLDGVPECASNPGGDVYTDDVYVDNSVARVVLANAATFDGSTKRQVQRATAWSNGSVTVVGNTRNFAAGETAYLLVMDASNTQRGSQQVTVQ